MNDADINEYVFRYESRLAEFGYDSQTLGWGKEGKQDVRFSILGECILADGQCSVLDVGCGFGDLYHYLCSRGWKGCYTGVDIVPGLVKTANHLFPEIDVRLGDITSDRFLDIGTYDYVVASGVMNARLVNDDNKEHILRMIRKMYELADKTVCVDFMTTLVDFQKEGAWHTDPAWILAQLPAITKRFTLRHDYMPFEFAVFLYKDSARSARHVFEAYEAHMLQNKLLGIRP